MVVNGSPTPIVIGTCLSATLGRSLAAAPNFCAAAAISARSGAERSDERPSAPRSPAACDEVPAELDLVPGDAADVVGRRIGGVGQRAVEQVQQRLVLPEAEPEGDDERDRDDDQSLAQLVEMVDDAEPVLVTDGAENSGHRSPTGRACAPVRAEPSRQALCSGPTSAESRRSAVEGSAAGRVTGSAGADASAGLSSSSS